MELTTADDLRTVYRRPEGGPVDKVIPTLDHHCVEFLGRSPFFVLSTADGDGVCDGSPKGGPPGFVEALAHRPLVPLVHHLRSRLLGVALDLCCLDPATDGNVVKREVEGLEHRVNSEGISECPRSLRANDARISI